MMKLNWTYAMLAGCVALAVSGCGGGGSSTVTPASETYVKGSYSGTFVDGANVFGQGANASATITYDDTKPDPNGNLAFVKNGVTTNIPIDVSTFLEPTSVAFTISEPANASEYLVLGNPGLTVNGTNTYSASAYEYEYPNGPTPVQQGPGASMTVTYQGP